MISSCKEATRLASDAFERKLSIRERLSLRMHLLICHMCRTAVDSFDKLHRITGLMQQEDAGIGLPESKREKIRQILKLEKASGSE